MTDLATIEPVPAPTRSRSTKRPRISARLLQAIELIETGECETQKAAAIRAGITETYLSRALKQDKIQAFIERRAAENISRGVLMASHRFPKLIHAQSEHVAAKVSERLLEHAGVLRAPAGNSVNVSISNNIASGYVVDLAGQADISAKNVDAIVDTQTTRNGE